MADDNYYMDESDRYELHILFTEEDKIRDTCELITDKEMWIDDVFGILCDTFDHTHTPNVLAVFTLGEQSRKIIDRDEFNNWEWDLDEVEAVLGDTTITEQEPQYEIFEGEGVKIVGWGEFKAWLDNLPPIRTIKTVDGEEEYITEGEYQEAKTQYGPHFGTSTYHLIINDKGEERLATEEEYKAWKSKC